MCKYIHVRIHLRIHAYIYICIQTPKMREMTRKWLGKDVSVSFISPPPFFRIAKDFKTYVALDTLKLQHCNNLQHTPYLVELTNNEVTRKLQTLQHAATPCNTLKHPATYTLSRQSSHSTETLSKCNTLQHPTTPCNTQPIWVDLQNNVTLDTLKLQHPAPPCTTLQQHTPYPGRAQQLRRLWRPENATHRNTEHSVP